MPKENPYLIENKKLIEIVQELEKYEVKKSSLSAVARSKVISKSGSGYVSENKEEYGPCSYSPYEVNSHKIAGKHINECGSLDCSYYRRIVGNRAGGTLGTVTSIGAGVGF